MGVALELGTHGEPAPFAAELEAVLAADPAQVIDDFTKAQALLLNTGGPTKVTKDAAAHYLAKAYLTRASEINDSWNSDTKTADLQQVVTLSDQVIANHPLAANYANLWDYKAPDGANEKLPELIYTHSESANTDLNPIPL